MQELNLVWLQGQGCDGDSMSVLDASNPDFLTFLERYKINLVYHPTLTPSFGKDAQKIFRDCLSGKTRVDIFVFEGAVPMKKGFGDFAGGRTIKKIVENFSAQAQITLAIGTCAAFGGVPATYPNESGSVGLQFDKNKIGGCLGEDYVSQMGFPVINIPGCPTHPDWVINTLLSFRIGQPVVLDEYNRPKDYFEETVHRGCKLCEFHENGLWAEQPGEIGCMAAKMGCKGRTTNADCNIRLWNEVSSCTRSGSPCIGCCDPGFPTTMLPFDKETVNLPKNIKDEIQDRDKVIYGGENE